MDLPRISAVVLSPDDYSSVVTLLSCLQTQAEASSLELVMVHPAGARPLVPAEVAGCFSGVRYVEVERKGSTAEARAAGIRAATAPLVVLTEDHSLPEPGWAAALLEAHREPRAVVGPAIVNGNPESLLSWANLVIEYGQWLHPARSGPARHLPGHNSCYRRELLLAYGDQLGQWLEAESVLHWDLRTKGHQLWLSAEARTRHHNFSLLWPSLRLRFLAGWHFAGMCRLRWPLSRRLLYIAASPLIPLVRLWRIVRQLRQSGRPRHLLPALLPLCLALLAVETLGAVLGYMAGPGTAPRRIADIDFHRERFMRAEERWRLSGDS